MADASASSAAPEGSSDPQRAIEEADVIKVDGKRLYALSRYAGIGVIDITDPDHMKMLGRKRTDGMPFEMYVRNGVAYVMLTNFGKWEPSQGAWVATSEIVALDLHDPSNIKEVSHFDVPGDISDSRLVGDALYLVTYENGYCWGCSTTPSTIVTSFTIGESITQADRLVFSSGDKSYSGWKRSVSATDQHLYIAGPEWGWTAQSKNGQSVIDVVDITDPTGKLRRGASVPVAGQVNNRWQMDEYKGVLRVVSQFGNGWGGANNSNDPLVQTFAVASATSITPLGQTAIKLPKPESLRSVRFDGTRGYAITAEQTDPLFTIDLSDPAKPRQAGELTMPGFVIHMEPRGDRLIGFGYDDTRMANAKPAVSLFDVSNIGSPKLIKRVSFGASWGQYAEDQDRIHKSVQVLDDQGLVLVPFASYGRWDNGGCIKGQSGIQLIDYAHDDLTLRGVAPQYGMPRRALIANGRLLAVSDRNVTSFDITSRDNPTKTSELDMSNPAYRMVEVGDKVASITSDWWSGEPLLSLTPKSGEDAQSVGKVSLAGFAATDSSKCGGQYGWTEWYSARLFATGNHVVVTVPTYSWSAAGQGLSEKTLVAGVVDVRDPTKPVLVGKTAVSMPRSGSSYSYYGGRYGYSGLVNSGDDLVQVGSKLAYLDVNVTSLRNELFGWRYAMKFERNLHVIDFTSASSPVAHAPVNLGESLGATPLLVWNNLVLTSRWLTSPDHEDKVRFYADRVDISGALPRRLSSINTPGSLLLADTASSRFVTVDYKADRMPSLDSATCREALGDDAWLNYDAALCVRITRSFKLVDVSDTTVTLVDTFNPPSQNFAGVQTDGDRAFIPRASRYDWSSWPSSPTVTEAGGLWVLGGVREGKLSIVSQMDGDVQSIAAARGTKVALTNESSLGIWDTSAARGTLVKEVALRSNGYASQVLLSNDRAICALGEFGIETVAY